MSAAVEVVVMVFFLLMRMSVAEKKCGYAICGIGTPSAACVLFVCGIDVTGTTFMVRLSVITGVFWCG